MSEVGQYLDDMVDRLAGTGAAGRRALAETGDPLRAAVAGGIARGLPARQAEHQAVARFGKSARIARQLRSAHSGGRLHRALSSGWLLAGLALAGLGVSYLAAATSMAVSGWGHPACSVVLTTGCRDSLPVIRTAATGTMVLILGVLVLLGRRLAMRFAGLAASTRGAPQHAAVMSALAGVAFYAAAAVTPGAGLPFIAPGGAGVKTPLIASAVAWTASLAAAAWSLIRSPRPRQPR